MQSLVLDSKILKISEKLNLIELFLKNVRFHITCLFIESYERVSANCNMMIFRLNDILIVNYYYLPANQFKNSVKCEKDSLR